MEHNFGKNRRRTGGGAAYELLKIDTTGDDDEQASPPMAMEVKLNSKGHNKRRKHKSRSNKSHTSTELAATTTSLGLVTIHSSFQDLISPRADGIIAVEPRIHVDFGEAQFQDSTQEFQFEAQKSAVLTNGSVERSIGNFELGLDASSSTIDGRLRLSGQSSPVVSSIRGGSHTVFTELRQRTAADRSPDSPVKESGAEGSSKPTLTKVVSFKKADGDGLEQLPGHKTPPPRTSLSSYETPHLTEWERLMAANSECKCSIVSNKFFY